jgi:hypothetical protein
MRIYAHIQSDFSLAPWYERADPENGYVVHQNGWYSIYPVLERDPLLEQS